MGGAETLLVDTVNALARKGHKVWLIIINNDYDPALINAINPQISTLCLNRPKGSRNPWHLIRLNAAILKIAPNVIHAHNNNVVRSLAPWFRHKTVQTIHDINITLASTNVKFIGISKAVTADINRRYPKAHITCIPNGIDIDAIIQQSAPPAPEKIKLIQVARLITEKKGQDLIIRALAHLKSKWHTNYTIDFVGDGPDLELLRQLAVTQGVENQVHFIGSKSRQWVYANLCHYTAMCHPSRYEGFGLVIAEAMAARIPVVTTSDGGPGEIIGHGRFGIPFDNGDVESLTSALMSLLHPVAVNLDQAQQQIRQNYSVDAMTDKYIEIYRLIARKSLASTGQTHH